MNLNEQLNKMKSLMGINESVQNIPIHIPEKIKYTDVSEIEHPAQRYGGGNIRYVKVEDLWLFKEYDRSKGTEQSLLNIEKLKKSFIENGFTEGNELIMNYYYDDLSAKALLIEGNHRLVAAKQLDMEYLPVRVNAYRTDNKKGYRVFSNIEIDFQLCKAYGYYPSSVDASLVFDEDSLITGYLRGL